MYCKNTLLDDICAEIGYTATTVMAAWYGGTLVRIPINAIPDHAIAKVLGEASFARLVRAFPGQDLFIPKNATHQRVVRWRQIRDLLLSGKDVRAVSEEVGITPRHVHNTRHKLEGMRLLPLILTKPSPLKNVD